MNDSLDYKDALEQLPRCVLIVESDSTLCYLNPLAEELLRLGYGQVAKVGDLFLNFVGEAESERWVPLLRGAFRGNDAYGEVKRRLFDGTEQVLRVDAQPFKSSDGEKRIILIIEDVSARRVYENELLGMHQALREANGTRDTILSIIGHDLRSPIAQLNALMYMLRYSPDELDKARIDSYLDTLEESTRHLSATLNNLLGWSSLHRDSIKPKILQVNLVPVVEEAFGLLQLDADRKPVKLVHTHPDELFVPTDRDLMAYVIRNLVANAIKFSPSGTTIRVEQSKDDDAGYRLRVIDQGVGMPAEQVQKLLGGEPLVTTQGTMGEKGVGLGLSLCSEFVGMLKGTLDIDSLLGEGTTVTITLPMDMGS